MLAALKALVDRPKPPVDVYWLFTIAEEVGHGAAAIPPARDRLDGRGRQRAPRPRDRTRLNSASRCRMADMSGPFDYHLTRKLAKLCEDNDIRYQKDIFRHYRSDSASAIEAGADVRTALCDLRGPTRATATNASTCMRCARSPSF